MNRTTAFDNRDPLDFSDWMIGIGVSVLIHLLVGAAFFIFPHLDNESQPITPLNAIDVDLAYLPASMGKPDATGGEKGFDEPAPPPPAAEKIVETPPAEPEKISPPPRTEPAEKPAVKSDSAISLKKDKVPPKKKDEARKTPSEEELISKAIRSVAKNIGAPAEEVNPLADRMRRMAKEAEEGQGGPRGNGGTADGEQTESGLNATLIDRYKIFVKTQVSENWAFSQHLTGGKKSLETWVSFEVLPNGEITNVTITKRSGNDYMDSAASMAIKKSNPVRPHPPGLNRTSIKMGFKFKPNELN